MIPPPWLYLFCGFVFFASSGVAPVVAPRVGSPAEEERNYRFPRCQAETKTHADERSGAKRPAPNRWALAKTHRGPLSGLAAVAKQMSSCFGRG